MHTQKVHTLKNESYKEELLTLHKIHINSKDDFIFDDPHLSVKVQSLLKLQTESLLHINLQKVVYYDKQWELEAYKW